MGVGYECHVLLQHALPAVKEAEGGGWAGWEELTPALEAQHAQQEGASEAAAAAGEGSEEEEEGEEGQLLLQEAGPEETEEELLQR